MKVIAYRRVSTKSQGESGLGMDAQQAYIDQAIKTNGWELVGAFDDPAISGTVAPQDRPGMAQAIAMAKEQGAAILAAKVDRFSRDVEHLAGLIKRADLKVATMPLADKFQLHLFAALAEQERDFIRARTREALTALQARADAGEPEAVAKVTRRNNTIRVALAGRPDIPARAVRTQKSNEHAKKVRGAILVAQQEGCATLEEMAVWLNHESDVKPPRGGQWTPMAVKRVIDRNARMSAAKTIN